MKGKYYDTNYLLSTPLLTKITTKSTVHYLILFRMAGTSYKLALLITSLLTYSLVLVSYMNQPELYSCIVIENFMIKKLANC